MPSIERTVRVERPLAVVWEYLADFTTTTEWDPGTVTTRRTSGDGGPGTVYANTTAFLGRTTDITYTVIDREEQRLLRLRGVNDALTATDTLTFSGDGQRTSLLYRVQIELKGVSRVILPVMPLALRRLGDAAETGMRQALERL